MPTTNDRPNFILFMADQQRGDCLSLDGHPARLTPNMDSIGGSGTHFARGYRTEQSNHFLTDGREKYVWLPHNGQELLFDLHADPREKHDLSPDASHAQRLALWRGRLVAELRDRPEGFVKGDTLVAGRPYTAVPGAGVERAAAG